MRCYECGVEDVESAGDSKYQAYGGWQEAAIEELQKLEDAFDAVKVARSLKAHG